MSRAQNVALWVVQVLLALTFVGTGAWKLFTSPAELGQKFSWMGEQPVLLRVTGVVDALGGLGLVLPMLTGVKPRLTFFAALGCAALMVSAIVFHFSRGEAANTPFNFVLLCLSLLVALGRRKMPA
ncbi:MAG: DoxX family protein [Archangium sp.]